MKKVKTSSEVIGETIEQMRLAKGWTQGELAEKLGVSRVTVCQWEHGGCIPHVKLLKDVAEVLGTTVAKLLDEPKRRNVV